MIVADFVYIIEEIVDKIIEVGTNSTYSGNYIISIEEDIFPILKQELQENYLEFLEDKELLKSKIFKDLIESELASRDEVLSIDLTESGELDIIYGTSWCKKVDHNSIEFQPKANICKEILLQMYK